MQEKPRSLGAREAATGTAKEPSKPSLLARVPQWMWAVLAYAVITVMMTWPIGATLTTEVPGGGDAWQNIWNLWWVKESLLNLQTNPYHTTLVYYPDGANLYFHTLALSAGVFSLPFQLLGFNLVTTYNLVLLFTYVLAGLGTYLLCRYLTGNAWASFVGGLVFAFAPYHSAHIFGHMNLASLQWIPFYALFLLRALDAQYRDADHTEARPRSLFREWRDPVLAGLFLALNAYTEWTYAIFLVMLTGLLVAWKVLLPSERRESREAGLPLPLFGVRLLVVVASFVLFSTPIFFPTLAEAGQGYAQQPPEETLFYSADVINAFLPSELHPVWGKTIAEQVVQNIPPYLPLKNPSERVLFLGYTVLAVAVWALWRLRKDRRVLFWALVAFGSWVLSLGPVLQILGKSAFTPFGVHVPLPYLLLYKLPLFSIMRTPARFTVLIMLALAVLVACALATLSTRSKRQVDGPEDEDLANTPGRARSAQAILRPALLLAVPMLIMFEFIPVFPTVPPGWNVPIYAKIASEPGEFALLELPLRPFGDYMAYQTIHGKPIIGGYLSRRPPYPLLDENAAVHYLLDTTPIDDPVAAQVSEGRGVQELQQIGVKYVIIRWWAFTPEARASMESKLLTVMGRPPDLTYPADQVDVWQILP